MEKDEAGRLRAFRERFGRGWDADVGEEAEGKDVETGGSEAREAEGRKGKEKVKKEVVDGEEDSLFDLISGAASGKK